MSCSGFRFAKELDKITNLGAVKCIHGTVVLDWEKYGVHILDAALATVKSRPVAIAKNIANHQSFSISMDNGSSLVIDAIGNAEKTFHIGFLVKNGILESICTTIFLHSRKHSKLFLKCVKQAAP